MSSLWPNAFFFTAHISIWKSSENQVHVGYPKTVYSLTMLMQAHALRALVITWKPGELPVHVGSRS